MTNIINLVLAWGVSWGVEGLSNKRSMYRNFVYLYSLLTVWLLIHTLVVNKRKGLITLLNVALSSIVIMAIKTKSLLTFYVLFELSIVPITIIIFLYGYQPEKLRASMFLLLYTVVRSLPLLLWVIMSDSSFINSSLLSLPITLCFMVKSPLYLLHIWLPKAHVEAPIGGSIVLAGVLLKLGSYGLLLFLPYIKLNFLMVLYFRLSLLGSINGAFMCLRQGDFKLLIAYSSVVHMGVVILGFISGTELGFTCGLIIVIAHGLSSPFLFAFSYWIYNRTHSRLLLHNRRFRPILVFILMSLVSINMGVPPTMRVWSELFMIMCTLFLFSESLIILIIILFMGIVYNLYLYTFCIHSKYSHDIKHGETITVFPVCQVVYCSYVVLFCLDLFHVSNLLIP